MRIHLLLVVSLAALAFPACKKSVPPKPPAMVKTDPTTLEISKDKPLLYTYIDDKGAFLSTDKAEDVPEKVRGIVRVVDPTSPLPSAADTTRVWVVDLRELLSAGKTKAKSLSREAFETSAMVQLGPGQSSPMAGNHGPALMDDLAPGDAGVGGPTVVTLCGACKTAKQYLSSHHIPYAYKDIENDPAAMRELAAKAARLGVPTDRVPILDVRGRLMVGFDEARLQALLGPTI
jgi:glutaredoxin